MDSPNPNPETKPENQQEDHQTLVLISSPQSLPFSSFSLSLSTLIPSTLLPRTLPISSTAITIPTQASSLTKTLSLSSSTNANPPQFSFKSTISAVPLHSPLSQLPRRPSEPSSGAALRRATVVWFRSDLRISDNECLNAANSDSASVLPVYIFDPRDYGKSASSGFDRTGPYRASFLIDSVNDLRLRLRSRGSDLVVRLGDPGEVLRELAKAVGAEAVYAHREVSHDEARTEERIHRVARDDGFEVKYFWGSTLYHLDDLPFRLDDMPANYGGFRERVRGVSVRDTIEALDRMKSVPSRGDVEAGDIPSLSDLGISPVPVQDGRPAANASMVGGETEALERLKKFAAECQAQPPKDGKHDSIYGANFSCKISPWLAMGCLSPRTMFDELKKTTARTISASTNKKDGGGSGGMNWLLFELLWRDFFRFITKKYSSAKRQLDGAPATACTGALA